MTLADAIKDAVNETDHNTQARKVAQVADFMRFVKGWNYARSMQAVQTIIPGMDAATWDGLLLEADNLDRGNRIA